MAAFGHRPTPRFMPLPTPAVATLARLADRDDFTGPDNYVLASRRAREAHHERSRPHCEVRPEELKRLYDAFRPGCPRAGLVELSLGCRDGVLNRVVVQELSSLDEYAF
jgi:hypothetical protein